MWWHLDWRRRSWDEAEREFEERHPCGRPCDDPRCWPCRERRRAAERAAAGERCDCDCDGEHRGG
jgi:hypothetical protein